MIKAYYLTCITYLFIFADVVQCDPEYLYNEEAGGWLKVHRFPATWQEAFLRCHYEGAVLASALDKHLGNALHSVMTQSLKDNYIFLGTHDLFSKGDFVSVEGVPAANQAIKWGGEDISIRPGDCLIMTSYFDNSYRMFTSSCTEPRPYICYRKFDNATINECGTFDDKYQFKKTTGSCYKAHYEKQTWSTAYRICASEGTHLVVLNDKEEARVVKSMFPVQTGEINLWDRFHIGLLSWGDDRTWITINGDRIEDVFHDWNPGQPDNYKGDQGCANLLRAGTLDDIGCKERWMFVCEKSPDAIQFETPPIGIDERFQ